MEEYTNQALKLLSQKEIKEIYDIPKFDTESREKYFSIVGHNTIILSQFHTTPSKCLFIMQLGYFRAKKRFWTMNELLRAGADVEYILQRYFPQQKRDKTFSLKVSKPTRLTQQKYILEEFRYLKFDSSNRERAIDEIGRLVKIQARPSYVVRELFHFFEKERIISPAYSSLQNLVGMVLQRESKRLEGMIEQVLPAMVKGSLDNLLVDRKEFIHELTLLKKDPKDFSYRETMKTIAQKGLLGKYYQYLTDLPKNLDISIQNTQYYASLVYYYSIYKIGRMPTSYARFLLACFVFVRYQQMHDYLVKALLYKTRKYVELGKQKANEEMARINIRYRNRLEKAGLLLEMFLDNESIPDTLPFVDVRQKAFSIMERDELEYLTQSLKEEKVDLNKLEWENFDRLHAKVRLNLRSLVLNIDFKVLDENTKFIDVIGSFKDSWVKGRSLPDDLPTNWIKGEPRKFILAKDGHDKKRVEFQFYRKVCALIESGGLFVAESLSFRSLESDLISSSQWKYKEKILEELKLENLPVSPNKLLDKLEAELHTLFHKVNKDIESGINQYVKITGKNRKWTLPYTKNEKSPNYRLFDQIPPIRLASLIFIVNNHCQFTNAFQHILGRHVKKTKEVRNVMAAIMATGTNMGLAKMARNSNIPYNELNSAYKNYIRPETLKRACDAIIDHINSKEILPYWNIDGDYIYSSSDGQKFETGKETFNARYATKYFGLNKGIVSYTLNANYLPLNAHLIGANEYEGHFVLDILQGNTSEVKPDIHTTDSHGVNRINFALLFFFGYSFAPRYRNLPNEAANLHSFSGLKASENWLIKPTGCINRELIEDAWDSILRVNASLAMQTVSQSTLIKKLNSYPRKNNTGKALAEFDKILRSIHILKYIDSLKFRQNIQQALNRGESFHSMKKALFYDNLGEFKAPSEYEQLIWAESTRLLSLCIIYYNAFVISQVAHRQKDMDVMAEIFQRISPIQWKHVDWFGRFFFGDELNPNELNELLEAIENMDFTLFSTNSTF